MKKAIKISNKLIGEGQPVFIIAEAGVNHNGSLKLAKKLVDAAKLAGADAVKFQTFKAEGVATAQVGMAKYQEKNAGKTESQLEMIKKLELPYADFKILKQHCDTQGIIFMSTPHSFDAVDFLNPLVPCFKIGSGDLTNTPLLVAVAKKRKPVILGTGMATLQEVREAVTIIKEQGNENIVLLHCTTDYPCPLADVNLNAMSMLRNRFKCLIGYSDHTQGTVVPIVAASLGAVVIEKHFTLDDALSGPDHKASLEPVELKAMVQAIRNVPVIMGRAVKRPTKTELEHRAVARKSIVVEHDIKKGAIIAQNALSIKRPGTGLAPKYLTKIVGKKAKRDLKNNTLIKWSDVI